MPYSLDNMPCVRNRYINAERTIYPVVHVSRHYKVMSCVRVDMSDKQEQYVRYGITYTLATEIM